MTSSSAGPGRHRLRRARHRAGSYVRQDQRAEAMSCFDEVPMTLDYARYLAAKTTVDDRALNRHVLAELCRLMPAGAPRVLEVGAGLGTMVTRLMEWGAVGGGEYILLDA